jgi:putative ABC transport system substrate-binding protein
LRRSSNIHNAVQFFDLSIVNPSAMLSIDFRLGEKSMKQKSFLGSLGFQSDNQKSKSGPADQNLKWVGVLAILVLLLRCVETAEAQQPKKVARACYLGNAVSGPQAIYIKMFRERLRELGHVEGQNISIEYRDFEGKVERLPVLATELVGVNCDVIVTQGNEATQAAKDATKTIPVVMALGSDAVRLGLVADLARPGGNITGMTDMGAELYGKRLELLKEAVPGLARVAFLWSSSSQDADYNVKETEPVARFLRVGIQSLDVKGPDDIDGAFRAATKGRANGLMLSGGALFGFHHKRIIDLAAKNRLPAIYIVERFVEAGGLMSYGEDRAEMFRRSAEMVDKILKGTKPADIPMERAKKFDLVINLNAAKQIGLTVPPNVLVRASRVIR